MLPVRNPHSLVPRLHSETRGVAQGTDGTPPAAVDAGGFW